MLKICHILFGMEILIVYMLVVQKIFLAILAKNIMMIQIKVEYWTQMVRLTQKNFDKLRNIVNNMLAVDNGTLFLRMAYEEVLFPVVFTGKKKYYGYQHME